MSLVDVCTLSLHDALPIWGTVMSDSIALKKHKLELNRETIMPLNRDVLQNVVGGDNLVKDVVTSAAGSAQTGTAVTHAATEPASACPVEGAIASGIGSALS